MIANAADRRQRSVNMAYDLGEGDPVRWFAQPISAFSPAATLDKAGGLQIIENLLEEPFWDVLALGDRLDSEDGMVRIEPEDDQGTEGILTTDRKSHGAKVGYSDRRYQDESPSAGNSAKRIASGGRRVQALGTVAMNANVSYLKGLDYSVVQQCMHCGLCLPTCPTYDATKLERHSPRGRISLMRAIADDRLAPTRVFAEEMYFCLGCLACMTACPAGVNYAGLFEHARAEVERLGQLNTLKRRTIRGFTVAWLFMDLRRLRLLGRLMRFYQWCGFQRLLRGSGVLKLLPARLRDLEAMTPDIQARYSDELIPEVMPAAGRRRYRVAMLTGCAQDLIFSDVNRDTAEVLARNGCEVVTPRNQQCCGSLHAHNGEIELARQLARRNIDQIPPEQFDAIITNAGGCGSHLRHYRDLLKEDSEYRARAEQWDRKCLDVHEWLVAIGIEPPRVQDTPVLEVTYHESCHLSHGQKVTAQPRRLLQTIPNVRLVELPEATWCCGSAGIYNITQPEMAGRLLDRKMRNIESTRAVVVATANTGCHLQLINGAKARGLRVRVVHPMTLLAEAYRSGPEPGKGQSAGMASENAV
jgi:glycolate oxidase iron-sulfur subunit